MWIETLLLLVHLLAAIVWVGGMVLMHFIVRPAAVATLAPPQRLPFLAQALGRFFDWVLVALTLLLLSGLVMIGIAGGLAGVPRGVHAMLLIGLIMAGVFGWIRWRLQPRLQAQVTAQAWPQAGQWLARIRTLVAINLALGVLAIVALRLDRLLP
jgi:uncharacterized membrane protein